MKFFEKDYKFLIIMMVMMLTLVACNSTNKVSDSDEDLFKFKNTLIGSNSAVGQIVHQLPANDKLDKMMLETEQEPYGLSLNYKNDNNPLSPDDWEQTIVYNASFIFALIPNVDRITFTVEEKTYVIHREFLQKWYDGHVLVEFESTNDLKEFIGKYISDQQKMDQLFEVVANQ
ncbi:DUF4825 domain-containing protein [Paenibacillus sp. FSL H8-0537]|uniref:DUF4825 domain-containing protein n=1 Tax=Paenibacillus sp. FSL H8-0537 TaxID=2921399 RepID=UPI003101423E